MKSTKELLKEAISNKKCVKFIYTENRGERIIEPFVLGVTLANNTAIRAWKIKGGSKIINKYHWRLYLLSKMIEVEILEDSFDGIRPDYNPNDHGMKYVDIHV